MAVHKVPQDVEADDKFLGPLSFKQFLFFGGTAIFGYLTFLTLSKVWPLSIVFAVPTLAFGALAFPWSKEQPTELFLASRIRFLIKPRKRIWNQSGVRELVNITAPVRQAHIYSDGLSQNEVRGRLNALATMVDSRGWAIKNIHSVYTGAGYEESDRLVAAPIIPDEKTAIMQSAPDVFDDSAGTIARQFDTMIEQSEKERKSATLRLVEEARTKAKQITEENDLTGQTKRPAKKPENIQQNTQEQDQDFWFMHQLDQSTDPTLSTFQASSIIAPGQAPTPLQVQLTDNGNSPELTEQQLLEAVHKKHERDALQTHSRREKIINPSGYNPPVQDVDSNPESQTPDPTINTMTPPTNPDIINLASNNDRSVESLAREANKKKDFGDDEVVISLH